MNMKKLLSMTLTLSLLAGTASADELLADQACLPYEELRMASGGGRALEMNVIGADDEVQLIEATENQSMALPKFEFSCKDYHKVNELLTYTKLILKTPAEVILLTRPDAFSAVMASLGIGMNLPTVATLTVLTGSGYAVYYVYLKKKIDECKAMDQKKLNALLSGKIQSTYGLIPQNSVQVEY
jgi:hypothetical protein